MINRQRFASIVVIALFASCMAQAQTPPPVSPTPVDDMETLFDKSSDPAPAPLTDVPPSNQAPTADKKTEEKKPLPEIRDVSDLGRLESFDDVAMIQRRYLPRTGRFEGFGAATLIMNDAFFASYGINARLAYYFQERYGVEGNFTYLAYSERQVTSDLREKRGVLTRSFVTPQAYYGADFKWSPIYGKVSFRDRKITPFDLYFSLGLGMTSTNQSATEPTLHLGTGQAFAISKSRALRWDFSWHVFTAGSTVAGSSRSVYHNLLLTLGMSFFYPEATYR